MQCDPVDQHAALQQLVDLGYIDQPDENADKAAAITLRELRYNLARDLADSQLHSSAIPLFQQLWGDDRDESRFAVHLLQSQLALGRAADAEATLERLLIEKQRCSQEAIAKLESLENEAREKGLEPHQLEEKDFRERVRLRRRAAVNTHTLAYLRGRVLAGLGRHEEAIASFEQARGVQIHNRPSLHQQIAESHLALGQLEQAEREYAAIGAIDPINPAYHLGLARVHSRRGEHQQALAQAIAAAGMVHALPQAHYACAYSLARLGRSVEAIRSLEVALAQNPVYPAAHRLMARLRRGQGQLEEAREHRLLARASIDRLRAYRRGEPLPGHTDLDRDLEVLFDQRVSLEALNATDSLPADPDVAVVVSGLPRSGTSMVMQMLAAGGHALLSDGQRVADASNPRGYQEYEPVKSLGRAPAVHWIEKTRGKAVKIVAPLLLHLPADRPYRIVFLERPLREVLASQAAMLERNGQSSTARNQRQLAAAYLQQVERLQALLQARGEAVQVLSIPYHQAIADPSGTAGRLNRFLGGWLDEAAMAAAIAPDLHRQRGQRPAEIPAAAEAPLAAAVST